MLLNIADLQKRMPLPEVLMFEMDDVHHTEEEEDRRILSNAYARWRVRHADIKMTEGASSELAAIFDLLNRDDDDDDKVADL